MIKLLIWLAGDCALIYAIDIFGFWREFAALAVLAAAFLWIIGGAFVFSRGLGRPRTKHGASAADAAAMRAAAERATPQGSPLSADAPGTQTRDSFIAALERDRKKVGI